MRVGEVRVADEQDFDDLAYVVDNLDGWRLDFFKAPTKVWTKAAADTDFRMIKVKTTFSDVEAATVYDVLHDAGYRRSWDRFMLASAPIGRLSASSELSYYAARCPAPLRDRDLVLLRAWQATPRAYSVLSHSVFHAQHPPRPDRVRAVSHLTGFVVRPLAPRGCELHYVTHADPGGRLPAWLVNRLAECLAPRLVRRLHRAARAYPGWKRRHDAELKPWLYPHQMSSPRLDLSLCRRSLQQESQPVPDESDVELKTHMAENFLDLADK